MDAIYLRKSRTDAESGHQGRLSVLERHEKTLISLAKSMGRTIGHIYREVESGDSIAGRPQMQKLLQDVEQKAWDAVLVMEIERLARGDTLDQGIVAQTFKFTNTKIITPIKIYDPNDQFDEEYFEFGLFMSRREYKAINRRQQAGRDAAIREGKYIWNIPPYGYKRIKLQGQKGFTLEPELGEAEVVGLIFNLSVRGDNGDHLGAARIADRLNEMGTPTRSGSPWTGATITGILHNPVYLGKIKKGYRPKIKKMIDGSIKATRPKNNDKLVLYDGLHPAIITQELWDEAQEGISHHWSPIPNPEEKTMKNPLSGLVVCSHCGKIMQRRPYSHGAPVSLICTTRGCPAVSSYLDAVEHAIIDQLQKWHQEYMTQWGTCKKNVPAQLEAAKKAHKKALDDLKKIEGQMDGLHDLLEQGVYDANTFVERSRKNAEKAEEIRTRLEKLEQEIATEELREFNKNNLAPKVQNLIEVYWSIDDPKMRNALLRGVLEKVVYNKTEGGRWGESNMDLYLYLKR